MAGGPVGNMTIKVDLDGTGFNKGIAGLNRQMKMVSSEMASNLSVFNKTDKSVEKLKTTYDGLTKKQQIQEEKVKRLKDKYTELSKETGENSAKTQAAAAEYNKANAELNAMTNEVESLNKQIKQMESPWTKIGKGMEEFGGKVQKIGSNMKDIGTKASMYITAPIVAGITTSIKSFADLEQAVGGVETLFKDSADTVIKNSESAYKRAGVSGVDYMENVTSFSATLLQGLEGDTEAAAKAADMAMVDMSDNANKFGTNIGDIQNAYQGFAKDNFTMLDNLKLGYGGTAGEMARLINESGVLGDSMEVTAETVKDVPFDKMIEAIHEVQTEMGVTGTTVKEAEETVSGSFGMMKASFQDLSAGFGQEGANIEGLFKNLWGSVGDFTNNIKRVLGTMWDNLPLEGWQKWLGAITVAMGPLFVVLGTAVMWFGSLMKTIGPLLGIVGKLGGITKVLGAAFTALTGPVGLTVLAITGLATAFGIAYAKSETFRNIVGGALENVKTVALIVKDAVVGFAQELFAKVKAFWQSDGEQVMQALQNAWTGVLKVVEFVAPAVSLIFKGLMMVIKMVWENIKGAISGALNVIMGLVKVFSGIFTGDFSKMWEGVKQIFTGAIQTVWNVFSLLFYGRIIKGVGSFVRIFSGSIRGLWTSVVGFFKNMFTGSVNQVTNLYNRATNIGNLIKNGLSGAIRGAKDNVVNLFNSMRTRSLEQINKILGGVRSLPSKMKDALIAGKDKVASGIKSLGNSMAGTLGRVVNGVIGGINTVMEKIGIKKSISQWTVPAFSRGTGQGSPSGRLTRNGKIAMDTLATVGDKGPGNGKGTRELVHYPNGQVGLYDNDATIFAPKGTTIFNNKQTEELLGQLPKFSKGTGFWGSIKNIASKAFDYLTNPSKIFNAIVDNYMQAWNVGAFAKDLGKGAWKNMKSGLLEWVKARFSEAGTGKRQAWMDRYPITTPYSPFSAVPGYPRAFNGGRHYGIDWGTPTGVNLTSPVAGTVSRQSDHGGGNVARVDYGKGSMYFLHMNSVKTGKVGIGQSLGYSGNTGAFTTGPHVHVQDENPKTSFLQNRNTRNPLKMFKSHFNGGLIKTAGLFNLHPNEYVVPMDNPTNAMKLIALMSKELAGKSKQTNQLPNLMPRDNNRVEEKLDVMIELLSKLLDKPTDIHLNGKKMNDEFNEMNAIDAIMNF